MARTLSLELLNAMYASETDLVVIALLTISHPSFADIRISSDPTTRISEEPLVYGTVSRGLTYYFAPFQIQLPDDVEEQAPSCNFIIENVSRELIKIVRNLNLRLGPAQFQIELVTTADLDDPEITYPEFDIRSVQYNANTLTFTAQIDALVDEPYPARSFDPSGFPALHGLPP